VHIFILTIERAREAASMLPKGNAKVRDILKPKHHFAVSNIRLVSLQLRPFHLTPLTTLRV